jgi:predicted hotdog family 3-hydroxylacyl-ACP dehydratase
MLTRDRILDLIPHKGASFLLDHVIACSDKTIACVAISHLDPQNPLRKDGRLDPVCGVEYGLQAAALHGALTDGDGPQPVGYMASLRGIEFATERLDDEAHGKLHVEATLEGGDSAGRIYSFRLLTEAGEPIVTGRGTIVFTRHEGLAA